MSDYRYPDEMNVPAWGYGGRVPANLKAIDVLTALNAEHRAPDEDEQTALAMWCGWGACAEALSDSWNANKVRAALGDEGLAAAKASTINAHYTPLWLARSMWATFDRLSAGVSGPVVEPGCGHGVFIGTAPDPSRVVGIEMDPMSAAIAAALYPSARIVTAAIESTPLPAGGFAGAIGNVPFAQHKPYDRLLNPGRKMSLHNYCIMRALHATAPGGVVVLLTSRYTMDSQSTYAREQMAGLADLVGAVRFPSGGFEAMAGTKAIIDLLVFVRRADGATPGDMSWVDTTEVEVAGGSVKVGWREQIVNRGVVTLNRYWQDHPDHVLGVEGVARGLYSDNEYRVLPSETMPADQLTPRILAGLTAPAVAGRHAEIPAVHPEQVVAVDEAVGRLPGTILDFDGQFVEVVNPHLGTVEPHDPGKHAVELAALCRLRDLTVNVLDVQLDSHDRWAAAVADLADAYDRYATKFGPLNRATLSSRVKDGEEVVTRRTPPMGGFRDDPLWPLVSALECFDDATGVAVKADIFTERVVAAPCEPDVVGDPVAGLAACLADSTTVDVEWIAARCVMDVAVVLEVLSSAGHIFHDPDLGRWVTAAEYLSGDVRSKLASARRAFASAAA